MKRLLEEKTAAMDRMKHKLDEARAAGRGRAVADRSEAARLTDRLVHFVFVLARYALLIDGLLVSV